MKRFEFFLVVLVIVLSICVAFIFKNYIKERSERIRIESNQTELLQKNNNTELLLKKNELKVIILKDSFLKANKLLAKKINDLIKSNLILRIDTITKLEDRIIFISGDTIYKVVRESIYNDGWNLIYNSIQGDSIRNNLIIQDSFYFINSWSRKWFLGKKHDSWKFYNRNPKLSYHIEYQIKKVK